MVELPTLLRDVISSRLERHSNAQVGEIDLTTLDLLSHFAGEPGDITAVVWDGGRVRDRRWEPRIGLLNPCPGFRVLRLDDSATSGVLFEMRPAAQVLPDLGIDALIEVVVGNE